MWRPSAHPQIYLGNGHGHSGDTEKHPMFAGKDTCIFRTWQGSVGTVRDKLLHSSPPALSSGCDHSTTTPDLGLCSLFPAVNKLIIILRFPFILELTHYESSRSEISRFVELLTDFKLLLSAVADDTPFCACMCVFITLL